MACGLNTWEKCAGIPRIENVEEKAGVVGERWKANDHEQNEFLRQGSHW